MDDIVIVGAKRTPVGKFMGGLSQYAAHQLGARAIEAVIEQCGIDSKEISEVILGQVLVAGQGQNPARHAALIAGLPVTTPAWGVSQVCGSGLRAIVSGAQAIAQGDASIIIAGGQESMSQSMHAFYGRESRKVGAFETFDTMLFDGLTDAIFGCHMGVTAETIADRYSISRSDQDYFSAQSHRKATVARDDGHFAAEIFPLAVSESDGSRILRHDECIRDDATFENLIAIKPAFKKNGSVTAGNASPLNDGAAALMLCTGREAHRRDLPVLARISSWACTGVDPRIMGIAPVTASQKAIERAGWKTADLDLLELNEAFAAQAIAVQRELDCDPEKVNVSGGAIAIGHPIGASGARSLTTLVYNLRRLGLKKGLATLCIGGGMGISVCVEN